MRPVMLLVIASVAIVLMGPVAVAQPPQAPPPGPRAERPAGPLMQELKRMDQEDVRGLIEMVRMIRLSQELGLNDEETVVLVRQYNAIKKEAGNVQKERQEIAKELRELVTTGAPDNDIEKTLDQLIAKDKEALMMRFDAFERAAAGLTPTQKAKLYVFMGDFEKRMRNLIEKAKAQFREQRGEEMRKMMREGGPRRGSYGDDRSAEYGERRGAEDRGGWRRGGPKKQPAPPEETPSRQK
ncbi:MAG: hypothetical protein U9Q79_03335 [Candidatus Hydrogenedentes bacterium]|nr:hypothetical protein [Candidatus Hydrogenedentota bacterium]